MLYYADFSIARNGDILIITEGADLQKGDQVRWRIRNRKLMLTGNAALRVQVKLTPEDVRQFRSAASVNVMDVRNDGSFIVFADIGREAA